MTAYKDF
jgi:hypothetical protein